MHPRVTTACLVAVFLVAATLRSWRLGERSLWFDEASAYTSASQFGWIEMVERAGRNVHPPLYYAALRLWMGAFGEQPNGLRSLSVVLGLATIGALYLLCRDSPRLCRRATPEEDATARAIGVTAAAFLAVASYHIVWSQQIRMYTLGTFLTALSSWALLRALDAPRNGCSWWLFYAASASALMYTHNYGLFTVFAQALFLAGWVVWRSRRGEHRTAVPRFACGLGALLLVGLLYLPWVPVLWKQTAQVQADYWTEPLEGLTIPRALHALFLPRENLIQPDAASSLACTSVLAIMLVSALLTGRAGDWLLVLLAAVPVASAAAVSVAIAPIIDTRFLLFAQVGMCGAAAAVLWRHFGAVPRALLIAILVGGGLYGHWLHWRDLNIAGRPGMRGLVEHVLRHPTDGPVLVIHPALYHAARYHLRGHADARLYTGHLSPTHYHGAPILRPDDFIGSAELQSLRARRIWVLHTTGFNIGFRPAALPPQWRPLLGSSVTFEEVFRFQRDVSATIYEWQE